MKLNDKTLIAVGKFGAVYGVYGWLKVHSFTELADNILNYQPWIIAVRSKNYETIQVEDSEARANHIIVKIPNFDTPEAARVLTNQTIYIQRSQLPALKSNEYYWSDLEGLTVINKDGEILGTISYLIETGANDVMIVKGTKEMAIPYLFGSVVLEINLDKQEMRVDWQPL